MNVYAAKFEIVSTFPVRPIVTLSTLCFQGLNV